MTIPVQNKYYLDNNEYRTHVTFHTSDVSVFESDYYKSKFNVEDFKFKCEPEYDVVQRPKHYVLLEKDGINLEVRDVCEIIANRLQSRGYSGIFISDCVQLLQYLLRFDQKENDLQDLKKSKFYLEKMIEELSGVRDKSEELTTLTIKS